MATASDRPDRPSGDISCSEDFHIAALIRCATQQYRGWKRALKFSAHSKGSERQPINNVARWLAVITNKLSSITEAPGDTKALFTQQEALLIHFRAYLSSLACKGAVSKMAMQLFSCIIPLLLGHLSVSLTAISGSSTASLQLATKPALPADYMTTATGRQLTRSGPVRSQLTSLQSFAEGFLRQHMPPRDRTALPDLFISETVNMSIQARQASVWAAKVPLDIWLNNVVPYAW